MSNLYQVLQVSPEANTDVIRAAYRTLARAHHPDVNADPEATRQMRRLNAAYQILSDPDRRARYDAARARTAAVRSAGSRPSARGRVVAARAATEFASPRQVGPRRRDAEPLALAAVSASPARLGLLLLLVIALTAALLVGLWGLGNVLDDSSPYEIHLDVGAQPSLNRA